ncbi:MAG: aminoacetone oxidase family FAD-binding enzyme [Oscillospiraceae bacterium]|nr:aminoacetone oxidase family FAD-binding enzyme [Candidatus Equicaccousia limihippi]
MFDTVVIGGGAAGLTFSVMAKRLCPDLKILMVEKNGRVGKKLAVTGNGRCNITNTDLSAEHFHGDRKFAENIVGSFGYKDTVSFFESIGVIIKKEESGKCYPYSLQASSVVDALRFECDRLGVTTSCEDTVTKINKTENGYTVCGNKEYQTKTVIFAAGGMSGMSKYGTDGTAYKLLNKHKIIEPKPVIVQIKTDNTITKQLKGIKVEATVKIGNYTDMGEVLFCDYGLSGPPVLQLSRYANENDTVYLDLMPEYTDKQIEKMITDRKILGRDNAEFFTGMLNKRLGQVLIKQYGLNPQKLAQAIKNLPFTVKGTTGFVNAQTTHGGFDTKEINGDTSSKIYRGVFIIGEAVNVDGDCGGYNLQWAYASANAAAKAVCEYLK